MSIYRGVLRYDCPKCEHKTGDQVIGELECFSPMSTFVFLRISLFQRIVLKDNKVLMAVLSNGLGSERSWLKAVLRDLNKLAEHCHKLSEMRDSTIEGWTKLVLAYPKVFLKVIKEALSEEAVNKAAFWWPISKAKQRAHDSAVPKPVITYECEQCGYTCKSPQALSWHRYDAHKARNEVRKVIHSTVCV